FDKIILSNTPINKYLKEKVSKKNKSCQVENASKTNISEGSNSTIPVIKNVADDMLKDSNSKDKPDNSPLKEIYTEQTFTSFEIFEQYLKYYSV
ncbi:1830_t:CDS:2, partial [Scutellospora calospora]